MARRATYLNAAWEENSEALLVDAGDLFGRRNHSEQIQTEFLCKVTGTLGYDAIGLGERDLNYGLPFLRRMIAEYHLPFTNANVSDPETGELLLPEYIVVEKAGLRFGICAVLDSSSQIVSTVPRDAPFEIADPVAVLRELIPRLRGDEGVDAIILLSHLGDKGTEDLLGEVSGIDVAVVGHSFRHVEAERAVHQTILLNAAHEGRYMGRADLMMSRKDGQIKAVEVAVTSLDEAIDDDPVVRGLMDDYYAHLEEEKEAQRALFPRDLGSPDEHYLGERACKNCHEDTWATYAQSEHKRAFSGLRSQGMDLQPECLVCHTTGYRYYNGYGASRETDHLMGVQCEACHGYGTEHARDGAWAASAKESCSQCHDLRGTTHEDQGFEFDYATYWAKIEH